MLRSFTGWSDNHFNYLIIISTTWSDNHFNYHYSNMI